MIKRRCQSTEDQALGLMLGMFIGNAAGTAFNDKTPTDIPNLDIEYLHSNPPKYYSGDTQMAISVLEEMAQHGMIDQTSLQRRCMARFSQWRGYGGGMLEVLRRWQQGISIHQAASSLYEGSGNFGDGAAVRCAPIALFFGEKEIAPLLEQVTRCALLTHTHTYGVAGAQLFASSVLFSYTGVPPQEWLPRVFKLPVESAFKIKMGNVAQCYEKTVSAQESVQTIGNGPEAIEAVPAALYAALRFPDSVVDAVLFAISMGGDADTIGAMTGAIVGARTGASALPAEIVNSFENEREGVDFIRDLVGKMFE